VQECDSTAPILETGVIPVQIHENRVPEALLDEVLGEPFDYHRTT
jgi:hypothetical protein